MCADFCWSDKKEEKARGFWLVRREHTGQKKETGFTIFAILVMLLVSLPPPPTPPSKLRERGHTSIVLHFSRDDFKT